MLYIESRNVRIDLGTNKLDFFKHINIMHSVGLITKQ